MMTSETSPSAPPGLTGNGFACGPRAVPPGGPARGPQTKPLPEAAGGANGDVSLVMMLDLETEVEMKLPGRFKVSPQIAGAIKAVAGVVDVQTL